MERNKIKLSRATEHGEIINEIVPMENSFQIRSTIDIMPTSKKHRKQLQKDCYETSENENGSLRCVTVSVIPYDFLKTIVENENLSKEVMSWIYKGE